MPNDNPQDPWHYPTSRLGKAWVTGWRKVYNPIGFKKGYNFVLWTITVGALMGFVLARFQYLDINGRFRYGAIPMDSVHYLGGHRRIGIIIHLVGVLFGGFFACFQFVPIIRYKFILFHRLNGYVVILLLLLSQAGAFMIIRTSAGGSAATQTGLYILGIGVTSAVLLSYYNIKRLQIDQHRAWMIRTWVYCGAIITLRIIQFAALACLDKSEYYDVQSCSDIWKMYRLYGAPDAQNPTPLLYPACTGSNAPGSVAVPLTASGPEGASAVANTTFGIGLWVAIVLHAFGAELYLALTPAETERLKEVSYERQVKAGMKHPGRAGLTVDRLGDAPTWRPANSAGKGRDQGSSSASESEN